VRGGEKLRPHPGEKELRTVHGRRLAAHSATVTIRPKEGTTERQVIVSSDGSTQFVKVPDAWLDFFSVSAAPQRRR
jgi:hypothetical protein